MTEFPPGRWSYLIIGDQWPTDQDLTALNIGRNNREALESSFTHFVTLLRAAQTGPFSNQRGLTAEDLRNAFRHGEKAVQRVAEKNTIKASAYRMAYDSVLSLQHDLTKQLRRKLERRRWALSARSGVEGEFICAGCGSNS
ncbi:hypothetical protein Mkiyose1665_39680 [Mycobacterium kiyosense]|nr:hypothetical protein IWGMT90018_27100 [Mycobacterium kiyosense]BDE14464.1 hypothetical protein MKCMC460_33240 [Mycobacterium sp. 20KCMC460]GLB93208.1 hypothetical protein SRL2020130_60250 [Mycobacterium kiyosense]GLC02166.1 hypothetical protein SRL2020400_27570 [Mycobacterium kiyosense]GLC10577.1 hypothetical protein SRL2020411_52230 [Mycobacterium kiyosense]